MVEIGENSGNNDRIVVPLFRTLHLTSTHGCLDKLAAKAE